MGSLFGGTPKAKVAPPAPAPEPPPPTPLPDAGDLILKARKRRAAAGQVQKSGMQSTILSDSGSEMLGG